MNNKKEYMRKMKLIYRLHIGCPAGHTTYRDYKTKLSADKNLKSMTNKNDWYATKIEVIKGTVK